VYSKFYDLNILQVYYKLVTPQESGKVSPDLSTISKQQNPYQMLLWLVIGIGTLLRLYHYFDNRSLWVDEIYLVTSIIKMDFIALATSSLEYQQKAPIGFLWLVKACVVLFGMGEKSLRFIPFLAGIGSLLLFKPIVKQYLPSFSGILAMAILAVAPPIVYHSVEIKQYSTDLFATILSLYLYMRYNKDLRFSSVFLWGALGAAILWFSFPAIFVLAGIAIGLSLYYLLKKDWKALFKSVIPFAMWLLSFLTNFLFFTHKHTEADWLISWFRNRGGFRPLESSFMEAIGWIVQVTYRLLDYPLGVLWNAESFASIESTTLRILSKMAPILVLFWGIGLYHYFKRDKKFFLILVLPITLTLIASLLNKYPFYERLVVFLAPLPIFCLAYGCGKLTSSFVSRYKWVYIFPLMLLGWPIWSSASQVVETDLFWDYKKSYYRDAILYVDSKLQEGDVVYVYWNAKPAYRFYKKSYGLRLQGHELTDARFLVSNHEEYLERLRPEYENTEEVKRIWFIYERFLMLEIGDYDRTPGWYHHKGIKGGEILKKDFSRLGKEVDSFIGTNIGVSLYEVHAKKPISVIQEKAGFL
jgi:hypothetical protein